MPLCSAPALPSLSSLSFVLLGHWTKLPHSCVGSPQRSRLCGAFLHPTRIRAASYYLPDQRPAALSSGLRPVLAALIPPSAHTALSSASQFLATEREHWR